MIEVKERAVNETAKIEIEIQKKGYCEITPGVFLWDQESIIEDQKEWGKSDDAKNFDFTTDNFWATTDGGHEPEGFTDIDDAVEFEYI